MMVFNVYANDDFDGPFATIEEANDNARLGRKCWVIL